jgi:hypothetical protein
MHERRFHEQVAEDRLVADERVLPIDVGGHPRVRLAVRAPQADTRTEHVRGTGLLQPLPLPRETLGQRHIVGIHTGEYRCARFLGGGVERGHQAAGRRAPHADARIASRRRLEDAAAVVPRAVVHRHHLVIVKRLRGQGAEAAVECRSGVTHGQEDGDPRRRHA